MMRKYLLAAGATAALSCFAAPAMAQDTRVCDEYTVLPDGTTCGGQAPYVTVAVEGQSSDGVTYQGAVDEAVQDVLLGEGEYVEVEVTFYPESTSTQSISQSNDDDKPPVEAPKPVTIRARSDVATRGGGSGRAGAVAQAVGRAVSAVASTLFGGKAGFSIEYTHTKPDGETRSFKASGYVEK